MRHFRGIGGALAALRHRVGRTQREIEEEIGMGQGVLTQYEVGHRKPSLDTLDRLLDAYGSDPAELAEALRAEQGLPPSAEEILEGIDEIGGQLRRLKARLARERKSS